MLLLLFCTLLLSPGDTGACSPLGPASLSSAGLLGEDGDLGLLVPDVLVDGVEGGVSLGLGLVADAAGPLGDDAGILPGVVGGRVAGALGAWYILIISAGAASVGTLGFIIQHSLLPIANFTRFTHLHGFQFDFLDQLAFRFPISFPVPISNFQLAFLPGCDEGFSVHCCCLASW